MNHEISHDSSQDEFEVDCSYAKPTMKSISSIQKEDSESIIQNKCVEDAAIQELEKDESQDKASSECSEKSIVFDYTPNVSEDIAKIHEKTKHRVVAVEENQEKSDNTRRWKRGRGLVDAIEESHPQREIVGISQVETQAVRSEDIESSDIGEVNSKKFLMISDGVSAFSATKAGGEKNENSIYQTDPKHDISPSEPCEESNDEQAPKKKFKSSTKSSRKDSPQIETSKVEVKRVTRSKGRKASNKEKCTIEENSRRGATRSRRAKEVLSEKGNKKSLVGQERKDRDVSQRKVTRSKKTIESLDPVKSSPSPKTLKNVGIEKSTQTAIRIMFTGMDKDPLEKKVLAIGGTVTQDPEDATHLVLSRLKRTVNLCCALSKVRFVLHHSWVEDSFKHGFWLKESDKYKLKDPTAERKFDFKLEDAMLNRESGPCMQGYSFLLMQDTKPSVSDIRKIIDCAGGIILSQCPHRPLPGDMFIISEMTKTKRGSSMESIAREMADKCNVGVYSSELILDAALRQRLRPEKYLLYQGIKHANNDLIETTKNEKTMNASKKGKRKLEVDSHVDRGAFGLRVETRRQREKSEQPKAKRKK